jgi:glutaconate CoA-transferase subunit A
LLVGEGRVAVYIDCYSANSGFTAVTRRYRSFIEKGKMLFEDYSQDAAVLMFTGAALGFPYVPFRAMLGSDLINKIGLSEEVRKKYPKLPSKKFVIQKDPFTGETVCLLPTPKLDVAIIHVQKASPDGTVRIEGDPFHDMDIAVSAKHTIVTCEELVTNDFIREDPQLNRVPGFCVDAVVHVPYGAFPSQCYNYYDLDDAMMHEYDKASKTDEGFKAYVDKYVYGTKNQEEYLDLLGASRLLNLRVVPGLGYVPRNKEAI